MPPKLPPIPPPIKEGTKYGSCIAVKNMGGYWLWECLETCKLYEDSAHLLIEIEHDKEGTPTGI